MDLFVKTRPTGTRLLNTRYPITLHLQSLGVNPNVVFVNLCSQYIIFNTDVAQLAAVVMVFFVSRPSSIVRVVITSKSNTWSYFVQICSFYFPASTFGRFYFLRPLV